VNKVKVAIISRCVFFFVVAVVVVHNGSLIQLKQGGKVIFIPAFVGVIVGDKTIYTIEVQRMFFEDALKKSKEFDDTDD